MKILVTGAGGLLGKEIVAMKRDGFEIVGTDHSELDVTDLASIKKAFLKERPEVVVNCAVILNVDLCQENPNLCFGVNRDGVSNILAMLKELGRPEIFFQISSFCHYRGSCSSRRFCKGKSIVDGKCNNFWISGCIRRIY